jgi:acyl-CoA synthetase (NDP forming)
VKAGRSAAGARAASSHTGARATSDALVETLLRQAGVIRTHTLEELFDVAALLANQPVPAGRRVGIVTNAGGPAILAADACEAHGLIVPALSDETARGLRAFLPAAASVGNPVDMIASAPAEHYRRTIELVLADPAIDSLLVIFIPPLVTQAESVAGAIREATAAHRAASEAGPGAPPAKPVLATFMGAHGELPLSRIPAYRFPESAAVALARATQYGEWLRRPPSEPPVFPDVDRQEARALVTRVLARGGGWMAPLESQALLQCFGIATAAGRVAHSADEAAAAAAAIGYPVVVKAAGERVLHKTELNAVKLRLPDPAAVRAAFDDLQARLGDRMDGALVQPMVTGGIEMVVGAVTDPAFGPLVMAGTGGVLVDLLGDTVFRMCPLTGDDAEDMLAELKGRVLLRGYRGAPPADEAAFRTALLRVSQLVETCPEIQEMDINPLLVLATGAVAVDVRVRIGLPPAPIKGRRISY